MRPGWAESLVWVATLIGWATVGEARQGRVDAAGDLLEAAGTGAIDAELVTATSANRRAHTSATVDGVQSCGAMIIFFLLQMKCISWMGW